MLERVFRFLRHGIWCNKFTGQLVLHLASWATSLYFSGAEFPTIHVLPSRIKSHKNQPLGNPYQKCVNS